MLGQRSLHPGNLHLTDLYYNVVQGLQRHNQSQPIMPIDIITYINEGDSSSDSPPQLNQDIQILRHQQKTTMLQNLDKMLEGIEEATRPSNAVHTFTPLETTPLSEMLEEQCSDKPQKNTPCNSATFWRF